MIKSLKLAKKPVCKGISIVTLLEASEQVTKDYICTISVHLTAKFPFSSRTLVILPCKMRGEASKIKGRSAALASNVASLTRHFPVPRKQQITLQIRYIIDSLLTNESMRSPAPVPESSWESSDLISSPFRLSKAIKSLPKADPKLTNPLPNNVQIAKIYSPSRCISSMKTGWKFKPAQSCSPVPSHRVIARSARTELHAFTPVLEPRRAARSPALPQLRMYESQRE